MMTSPEALSLHLKIIGVLFIGLSLIHLIFPKYFNWEEELSRLSLINKQMMVVHTFFIAFVVFLMGLLGLCFNEELVQTKLGKFICLGLGVFWSVRLLTQFFVYSSELWKGKTFETVVHVVFSCFWLYFSAVFWAVYFV